MIYLGPLPGWLNWFNSLGLSCVCYLYLWVDCFLLWFISCCRWFGLIFRWLWLIVPMGKLVWDCLSCLSFLLYVLAKLLNMCIIVLSITATWRVIQSTDLTAADSCTLLRKILATILWTPTLALHKLSEIFLHKFKFLFNLLPRLGCLLRMFSRSWFLPLEFLAHFIERLHSSIHYTELVRGLLLGSWFLCCRSSLWVRMIKS